MAEGKTAWSSGRCHSHLLIVVMCMRILSPCKKERNTVSWRVVLAANPAFSYHVFLKVTEERTVVKNEFSLFLLRAVAFR